MAVEQATEKNGELSGDEIVGSLLHNARELMK